MSQAQDEIDKYIDGIDEPKQQKPGYYYEYHHQQLIKDGMRRLSQDELFTNKERSRGESLVRTFGKFGNPSFRQYILAYKIVWAHKDELIARGLEVPDLPNARNYDLSKGSHSGSSRFDQAASGIALREKFASEGMKQEIEQRKEELRQRHQENQEFLDSIMKRKQEKHNMNPQQNEAKELVVVDAVSTSVEIVREPAIVLSEAAKAATALKDVIKKKAKPVIINGEQFLEFEDWQTLGRFYGYSVRTHDSTSIELDGVKGFRAIADLLDNAGNVVGGAESFCMRDEPKWKDRPSFQLASMAQTRAGAKAFRSKLSWVAVLAGYRPTPAEELDGEQSHSQASSRKETPFPNKYPNKGWDELDLDFLKWASENLTDADKKAKAKEVYERRKNSINAASEPPQAQTAASKGFIPANQAEKQEADQLFSKLCAIVDSKVFEKKENEALLRCWHNYTTIADLRNYFQKAESAYNAKLEELRKQHEKKAA